MSARDDDHIRSVQSGPVSPDLWEVLKQAQRVGFVGPSSLTAAVRHGQGFASAAGVIPERMLDLGSGGGLPGLVLAEMWPWAEVVLLDSHQRRIEFLQRAVTAVGLSERVSVVGQRAEVAGRLPQLRGRFDLVVARGFGRPGVTAECGAPFVKVGGKLIVSEPPEEGTGAEGDALDRWPPKGLASLGLVRGETWSDRYRYQELGARLPCPERFPRRVGIPAKRPLF